MRSDIETKDADAHRSFQTEAMASDFFFKKKIVKKQRAQ
jgi:hypothetical protein